MWSFFRKMNPVDDNKTAAHQRPLASIVNHGTQYVHGTTSEIETILNGTASTANGFGTNNTFVPHGYVSSQHHGQIPTPFFHHPSYGHAMPSTYYQETHRHNNKSRNLIIALVLVSLLTFLVQLYNPYFSNLSTMVIANHLSRIPVRTTDGQEKLIQNRNVKNDNRRKSRKSTANDIYNEDKDQFIDKNVSADKYPLARDVKLNSNQSQNVQTQQTPINNQLMTLGIEGKNTDLNYYDGLGTDIISRINTEITSIPVVFGMGGSFSGDLLKPSHFRQDFNEDLNHLQTILPANTELPGYKMGWDPRVGKEGDPGNRIPGDLAVLWNIPFSGTSVVLDIIRSCHRLVTTMAGDKVIGNISPEKIQELKIISPGLHAPNSLSSIQYVNVELSTQGDIVRAKDLGLAPSTLADVAITPFIYQMDHVFYDTNVRGRLFAVFRNPMDMATDKFYYMKYAKWETSYNPELMNISIDQYPKTNMFEGNWMTRKLANVPDDQEVTREHLNFALEMMRSRFVIGLYDALDESLDRFERYFGWKFDKAQGNQELCRSRFISRGYKNPNPKMKALEKGTEAYELISRQNQFDLEIYQYAKSLFVDQAQFVSETQPNSRLSGINTPVQL